LARSIAVAIDERLAEELRRRAPERRLPCAAAFELADELGIPRLKVGQAANELGIKITDCQLGCFRRGEKTGGAARK